MLLFIMNIIFWNCWTNSMEGIKYDRKRSLKNFFYFGLYYCLLNHPSIRTSKPKSYGYMNTIPHLDTVAGDATSKSSTSNIMFIRLVIISTLPDDKQSFLLSSKTVFIDSIHTASTGPSNNIH